MSKSFKIHSDCQHVSEYEHGVLKECNLYKKLNDVYPKIFLHGYKKLSKHTRLIHEDYNSKILCSNLEHRKIAEAIRCILELIGKYSNFRYGTSAQNQHQYFARPCEAETFPLHLARAMLAYKAEVIIGRQNADKQRYYESKVSHAGSILLELEGKNKIFFGTMGYKWSQKQLYAVGAHYMRTLMLEALRKNHPDKIPSLIEWTSLLISWLKVYLWKNEAKNQAYKLFCDNGFGSLPPKNVKKLAGQIYDALKSQGIQVKESTIARKWFAEFSQRYNQCD